MRRKGERLGAAALIALAGALLASAAVASPSKLYVLKHPRHERCKAHYRPRTRTVKLHGRKVKQTVCQHGHRPHGKPPFVHTAPSVVSPAPTPAPTPAPALTPTITVVIANESASPEGLTFFSLDASVIANNTDVIDVPIVYTLTDESTGQALASFTELTPLEPCAIVYTVEKGQQEFRGEGLGVPPRLACHLGVVKIPEGQTVVLTGAFAGNSTYAASVSEPQTL